MSAIQSVREQLSFKDTMGRLYDEIKQKVDAASIICGEAQLCDSKCPFNDEDFPDECVLHHLKEVMEV